MPKPKPTDKKIRLNLEMSTVAKALLDDLQSSTGAASCAEVLRRSLALYALVEKCRSEGVRLQMVHQDGSTEILHIL